MAYLYETHLHTAESSKCAVSTGADYIKYYIDMGYSGIIVTDHFFNGYTGISRKFPWKEWVKQFCRGYESAKNEGDKLGLDVFFGWEESFNYCDDYLVYGLDKEWLLEHPEACNWTRGEQYRAVRDAGGCVVQAHPFRQRSYVQRLVLSTGCVDAVEAANGGNDEASFDALARRYAKNIGKPVTAGSDAHNTAEILNKHYGVYSGKKLNNIKDFVDMILNNEIAGIKTDDTRFDFNGKEKVRVPCEIRDKNDRIIKKNWKELIV